MAGPRIGQHNFSKGVLSKELWGRQDIAPYSAGIRQGKNVLILKYGGLTKRPGTRLVYEIKDGPQRLIPFEGAYEASYAMLFGQATMRLGVSGGMMIEDRLVIEGATNTNPVAITASHHGYATGDEVFFQQVKGMTELNGLTLKVTVTGESSFTVPVDGTGFGVFAGEGDAEAVVRSAPPPPPPPPPPVPEPVPAPPPPPVGGGGGGGGGGGRWFEYEAQY